MNTFRFFDFPVYGKTKAFFKEILILSEGIKIFSLRDQIRRAALSIILNIAEGSAKKSDKDFARFLQISIGSVNEVVACLDILRDIKLIEESNYQNLLYISEEIAKQLGGFIKKLNQDINNN